MSQANRAARREWASRIGCLRVLLDLNSSPPAAHNAVRMLTVQAWLLALLLTVWQIPFSHAQGQSKTLCGTSDFYNSTSIPYSFNNNAWGDDGSGFSCMRIGDDDKSFTVNYRWTGDASVVKGFPYMKVWPSRLPVQLWNISALEFSAQWRIYVEGTQDQSPQEQAEAYDRTGLRVNAAVDMFLSDDITNSTGLGAPIEIMIWPWYTPTVLPLGHAESTPDIDTVEIDGTNYSLYHGWNQQGQHVFSWLANQNVTSTDADYAPLLKYIWDKGLLSGALYVGQLEFGTEVMHAGEETVFEAKDYTLKVIRDGDPDAPVSSTSSASSSATSTRSPSTTAETTATRTAEPASATSNGAISALSEKWGHSNFGGAGVGMAFALLTSSFLFVDNAT